MREGADRERPRKASKFLLAAGRTGLAPPRGTAGHMGCLGVHFAITDEDADRLLAADNDDALMEIVEQIEEEWEITHETDKAWDAMHRALTNGTLVVDEPEPTLSKVFFGARHLGENDDYFVVLATPAEVKEIADELEGVTEAWLRTQYFELPFPEYDCEKSDEDWGYTWENFRGLPEFYRRAAKEGLYVVFTVSQ